MLCRAEKVKKAMFLLEIKIVLMLNQQAKQSAGQMYEQAKDKFNQLDKKANKTPEQKKKEMQLKELGQEDDK
jgi:hypothetical protein